MLPYHLNNPILLPVAPLHVHCSKARGKRVRSACTFTSCEQTKVRAPQNTQGFWFPGHAHLSLLCFWARAGRRVGSRGRSGCPGQCLVGYTSPAGATDEKQCYLAYTLVEVASAPDVTVGWCGGANNNRQTNAECPYKNQGYEYITSREECEQAAKLIQGSQQNHTRTKLNVTVIRDQCPEYRDAAVNGGTKFRGVSEGCDQLLDQGVQSMAPVGYCGVELDSHPTDGQRLVLYTPDDGEQPRRFYKGSTFVAICKAKECTEMEEVSGSGAARPWDSGTGKSKAPAVADNAACVPNQAWYKSQASDEQARYDVFYTFVGIILATFLTVLACLFARNGGGDNRDDDAAGAGVGSKKPAKQAPEQQPRKASKRNVIATALILLRTLDFMTGGC